MKTAVDASTLALAYAGGGARQRAAASAIEEVLAEGVLFVPAGEMARFTRVVGDRDAFDPPPPPAEVAALFHSFASAVNVEVADLTADDYVAALDLIRERESDLSELDPALSAVRMRRGGVTKMLTAEPSAYREFPFVETRRIG